MTSTNDSAVYAFVADFVDAGIDAVADDLARKGFSSVALATVYHAARDLLPHNPKRAVAHRTEGVHYFASDGAAYTGPLGPPPSRDAEVGDFDRVTTALAERGMTWQAWTVYLHNCRLAIEHPEYAVTNAFGDSYITDLCPSSDDVATYATNLTADVARLAPSFVVAESLHHAGFGHGYHHERAFIDVPAVTAFLLSLCFCGSCGAKAAARDVDTLALAERVRRVVRGSLSGDVAVPSALSRDALAQVCGSPLLGYLGAREDTVTTLVTRCAETARAAGVAFGFIDQTGALKGYATGDPQGVPCADDAWRLGIAPPAVAGGVDAYVVLAYAQQVTRVAADIGAYAALTGGDASLRCVLRHGGVDYLGAPNLAAKVAAATRNGAAAIDFYHYGLMSLDGLDAASVAIGGVDLEPRGA